MKATAWIPQSEILKMGIYINTGRKTLEAIKKETGADYVMNGGLFDSRFRAVCHLRADNFTWAEDPYNYHGYGWDVNEPRVMLSDDKDSVRNFICCCELIRNGAPIAEPIYNPDRGGRRGRTAMALDAEGNVVLWCSKDGSSYARTPEELRDELAELKVESAIMLDGGGSSQCDLNGITIKSTRVVQNLICIWMKKKGETMDEEAERVVCLDPGHGGTEDYNASPDGNLYEHKLTLNLAQRVKRELDRHGVKVIMTRETDETVSLSRRATIANTQKADLFVSLHSNASGTGWSNAKGLCVYTYAAGGKRGEAADMLLERMTEAGVKIFGAGIYYKNFAVLATTDMPAYLVEYGFHTNKEEAKLLLDDAYREKLAVATAKAILDYFGMEWKAPVEPGKIYRVQVGAFSEEENAQQLARTLQALGYQTIVKEEVSA